MHPDSLEDTWSIYIVCSLNWRIDRRFRLVSETSCIDILGQLNFRRHFHEINRRNIRWKVADRLNHQWLVGHVKRGVAAPFDRSIIIFRLVTSTPDEPIHAADPFAIEYINASRRMLNGSTRNRFKDEFKSVLDLMHICVCHWLNRWPWIRNESNIWNYVFISTVKRYVQRNCIIYRFTSCVKNEFK